MSVKAMKWAALCDVRAVGFSATPVLRAVAWRAANAGDRNAAKASPPVEIPSGQAACWAGVAVLAADAGVNEKTVRTMLQRLEAHGVLHRERRARHEHGRVRRVEDVVFLDLTQAAVLVPADPELAEKRSRAGRAGAERAALNKLLRAQVASGKVAGNDRIASGQVAQPEGVSASGKVAGPPAGTSPERQRVGGPGVLRTGTPHSEAQGLAPQSGTARGLGTTAVDGLGPYDPVDDDDSALLQRMLAEFGNRKDRRLGTGSGWAPLRRANLGDAAFEGGVLRVYDELTNPDPDRDTERLQYRRETIPAHWWRASEGRRDDVWRVVRAELLDQQNGKPSAPAATTAVEVA